MPTNTLRELVESELEAQDEAAADIEGIAVGPRSSYNDGPTKLVNGLADLEQYEGSTGYGGQTLPGVRVWTADRVYFKACYDGSEWVASLPRHPTDDERPVAIGGG